MQLDRQDSEAKEEIFIKTAVLLISMSLAAPTATQLAATQLAAPAATPLLPIMSVRPNQTGYCAGAPSNFYSQSNQFIYMSTLVGRLL